MRRREYALERGERDALEREGWGVHALERGWRGMRLKGGGGMHLNEKEGVCT